MPELDVAISKYLDSQRNDDLNSVIAFGRPALYRVLDLYYRGRKKDVAPLIPSPAVRGYAAADAWGILVAGVGAEFPDEFLDWVERRRYLGRDPLLIVSVLKGVEGTRARNILIRYSEHRDKLIRYHAVAGLQWRDDAESISVVERHVSDPDPLVKLCASKGVARRDSERGRKLLIRMVGDIKVPPGIREDAQRYLSRMPAEGP